MSSGIVVDELVTLIKYEMDAHSKKILDDADKASKKGTANVNANSKAMKAATGVTSKLADTIKGLGVVSGVTSGIMAAWSINAGKEAARLSNLSQAVQLNMQDIQQLGSVYEQMNGDAKTFAQDAANYFNTYGKKLDVKAMKELADTFSKMAPDMAQHMGKAYGFSDDMIRVLMKGPGAIQAMTDKAERLGHVVKEEDIKSLAAMNSSWNDLKNTVSATSMVFQAGMSPAMTDGMNTLTEAISKNKEAFRLAGEVIGGYGKTLADVVAGLINGKGAIESFYAAAKMTPDETKENAKSSLDKGDDELWTEGYQTQLKGEGYSQEDARIIAVRKNQLRRLHMFKPEDQEQSDKFYKTSNEDLKPQNFSQDPVLRKKRIEGLKESGFSNDEILEFVNGKKHFTNEMVLERRDRKSPTGQGTEFQSSPSTKSMPERELIGPSVAPRNAPGGDYMNNSGNSATTQNVNVTVNQQITAPDSVLAGQMSIAEIQKATFAGSFQYGIAL